MGKLSFQDKLCILSCLVLMLMYSAAEREYFHQDETLSWDDARKHCQICFKDLVTLTPDNIQTIARNLSSEYWIGLRKNFNNSTSNSSMHWTRWANEDPLTFQNWYPGWPKLPKDSTKVCCSCSCTYLETTTSDQTSGTSPMNTQTASPEIITSDNTSAPSPMNTQTASPEMITSDNTSAPSPMNTQTASPEMITSDSTSAPFLMTTHEPVEATCNPISMVPEQLDIDYIEDSCVVMLSFGAWVVRNCSQHLRFICYEDTFIGEVNVTDLTSSSANFTWLEAPGDISHYRVEVRGDMTLIENTNNTMHGFDSLTEGTLYTVEVFPVKCGRDLNPQKVHFFTLPNKVKSLKVVNETETSVFLSWEPDGKVEFYRIEFLDKHRNFRTTSGEITSLEPGSLYTFKVYSGVNGSILSEETNITTYTKPGKVTNLRVFNSTKNSLLLQWDPPRGGYTGFRVMHGNETHTLRRTENQMNVIGLPVCTEITLSVSALASDTLEGDKVTVVSYTEPEPVSNLVLEAGLGYIEAHWTSLKGNCELFRVILQLDGKNEATDNVTVLYKKFESLKNTTKYKVIVYSISGHIMSTPVEASNFTLPVPPTNPKVTNLNATHVNFSWKAPDNMTTVEYQVIVNSSFWGQRWTVVSSKTSSIFGPLKTGTKYNFEVRSIADRLSDPASLTHHTDAVLREITLSMMCSSKMSLYCDEEDTRKSVFKELKQHFYNVLGEDISWNLNEMS